MKKTFLALSLLVMICTYHKGMAQSTSKSDTKTTAAKKDGDKSKPKDKKGSDVSVKNKDAMFTEKKKSWVIGIHAGFPFVIGDVPPSFGIGYGVNIQKALGYSFALRLHAAFGYCTGLNYQVNANSTLAQNQAVDGYNGVNTDYYHNSQNIYTNYKMTFTKLSLDGVFYLNNLNFNTENPKFLLYAVAGLGGFMYDTKVDQLDAKGNRYDYSKITPGTYATSQKTFNQLRSMLDGTYETQADRTDGPTIGGNSLTPLLTAGLGAVYKLTDRVSLTLEATYGFTGSDALDGQRWYNNGIPTANPDAFGYVNLGVNIRLGKTENVSWYGNPLSLPFKTLMDNKKKLEKVDRLEKQVADMNKKLDTAMSNIDSLLKDSDGDGVADYFDKEDSTPPGAVVDGAGRTIFYKDADGNLVYVDPNVGNAVNNATNGNGSNGGGNGSGNSNSDGNGGNNSGNGNGGSGNSNGSSGNGNNNSNGGNGGYDNANNGTSGSTGTGSKKRRKSANGKNVFDAADKNGKTIIYTNPSNKTTNINNVAGTNSKLGFLPAVFFTTNSSTLVQNYYPQLYEIAKLLKQNPNIKMHVIGYTDFRASASYNKQLGLRRAKEVEHALTVYFGVNGAQLIAESKGKVDPLTNAKSMGGLAANRRVQFQIDGDNTGNMKSDFEDKGTTTKSKTKTTKTTPGTGTGGSKFKKSPGSVKKTTPDATEKELPPPVKEDVNKAPADTTKKGDVFSPGSDF